VKRQRTQELCDLQRNSIYRVELLREDALTALRDRLLPLATLVNP
jgi:hypothetical protein